MTIVIMVLLALIRSGFYVSTQMGEWKRGREASEVLRQVYAAQRLYLADNPTISVSSITSANIIPYLQGGVTTMPTVISKTGTTLSIIVNVSPPVINSGNGTAYDPSKFTNDSLWDVGE
ncbi:MAG: hypothetical protein H8M99_01350 [Gloeobacteraceae cyanobacterium ES-bin-144]|nr:hypothetical protein [Verrucomicrobiales bacterium]